MRRKCSLLGFVVRCITQVRFERHKNADLGPERLASARPELQTEVDGEASSRGKRACCDQSLAPRESFPATPLS
jgi:hypothetical protein